MQHTSFVVLENVYPLEEYLFDRLLSRNLTDEGGSPGV